MPGFSMPTATGRSTFRPTRFSRGAELPATSRLRAIGTGPEPRKWGVFRPNYNGQWVLDWDGTHQNQRVYYFGGAGDKPVVGDWTGSGQSKIGVYRNGFWILDTNG